MKIRIADIRIVTERLLAHLEEIGYNTIELENDFYWHIPQEELYNPYKEPKDLTLGQLSDDWSDLEDILDENNYPVSLSLKDLASILRAIGEQVGK